MNGEEYDFASKLLHQFVLDTPLVGKACFELENIINENRPLIPAGPPVFITGLARAGTTILLQLLYQSGQFRSLTYRDMPFVLMPTLWSKISRPFHLKKPISARAHQDRVMIDYDSPEAFEEIFWRIFCGTEYIVSHSLRPHEPDEEIIAKFRMFVRNALVSGNGVHRYLSKNNNHLLRLAALKKAFPDAILLIPFRDPVQHAISLHRQHQLFTQRHQTDQFSKRYMTWLGHFEFSSNHKPFCFNKTESHYQPSDGVVYWLEYWLHVHEYLLAHAPNDALLLSYDQLCEDNRTLHQLVTMLGINSIDIRLHTSLEIKPHAEPDIPLALKQKVYDCFAALKERAKAPLKAHF